jgi:hypothetical protein
MSEFVEVVKIATVAVVVPLAVFSANWIHRSQMGYSQTAAADFILAVIIFDIVVVLTAQDFEPFLRSPELRPVMAYWHFVAGVISGLVWASIVRFGEPILASYYELKGSPLRPSFPGITFLLCWMSILVLIALHVGFYLIKKGDAHV